MGKDDSKICISNLLEAIIIILSIIEIVEVVYSVAFVIERNSYERFIIIFIVIQLILVLTIIILFYGVLERQHLYLLPCFFILLIRITYSITIYLCAIFLLLNWEGNVIWDGFLSKAAVILLLIPLVISLCMLSVIGSYYLILRKHNRRRTYDMPNIRNIRYHNIQGY